MATLDDFYHIRNQLAENGFAEIERLAEVASCITLRQHIQQQLQKLIVSHHCSAKIYFSAVNRWPLQAFVNPAQQRLLLAAITDTVKKITALTLQVVEIDILYKSPYANLGTPCHQDIAYVTNNPYVLSTWLALTDVSLLDSPMQFLPRSHQLPVADAVDFWQPDFIDTVQHSGEWQKNAITVPLNTANGVIFSANIWHSSLAYQGQSERFALVIRWGNHSLTTSAKRNFQATEANTQISSDSIFNPTGAQRKRYKTFSMWNCGSYTQALLQQGLKIIFNIELTDFLTIIKTWQQQLAYQTLPFAYDKQDVWLALEKLRILNEAYEMYGAGDGQGIVYAAIWRALLQRLEIYLR